MPRHNERALTLRFFLDGARGAGVTTILRNLADKTYTDVERGMIDAGESVDWLTFSTGSFEGSPIRLEVFGAAAGLSPERRRAARQLADGVVWVVDSTPAGVDAAHAHYADLADDLAAIARPSRPELLLLAHKQDARDAVSHDDIAARFRLADTVATAKTSVSEGGFVYVFAIGARSCLRRLRLLDEAGIERNQPWSLADLLGRTSAGAARPASPAQSAQPIASAPVAAASAPAVPPRHAGDRAPASVVAKSRLFADRGAQPSKTLAPPVRQAAPSGPAPFVPTAPAAPAPTRVPAAPAATVTVRPDQERVGPAPTAPAAERPTTAASATQGPAVHEPKTTTVATAAVRTPATTAAASTTTTDGARTGRRGALSRLISALRN